MRAGLILMMDRTFTQEQNEVIVDKAIRYRSRGVVGVDIAGPRPGPGRYPYRELEPLVEEARAAGLGVTIHVGEEGGGLGVEEIGEVLEHLRPERIGHGILAARDEETMRVLRETSTVLEDLPDLEPPHPRGRGRSGARGDLPHVPDRVAPFTVATDGPEMMRTHLQDELALLLRIGGLQPDEARAVNARGHESTFIEQRVLSQRI